MPHPEMLLMPHPEILLVRCSIPKAKFSHFTQHLLYATPPGCHLTHAQRPTHPHLARLRFRPLPHSSPKPSAARATSLHGSDGSTGTATGWPSTQPRVRRPTPDGAPWPHPIHASCSATGWHSEQSRALRAATPGRSIACWRCARACAGAGAEGVGGA
eukprot:365926-Chlamydomonas_euryale.AAC.5